MDWRLEIGDWGLEIGDWGLEITRSHRSCVGTLCVLHTGGCGVSAH